MMLTEPIFWSESSYQRALDLSWRRSRCVTPPEASDAHSSCPAGGRSMLVIRTSPDENTSRDTPVAKERLRIVQSYALVNTCRRQNATERQRVGQRALAKGGEERPLTLCELIGSNLIEEMEDLDVAGQCACNCHTLPSLFAARRVAGVPSASSSSSSPSSSVGARASHIPNCPCLSSTGQNHDQSLVTTRPSNQDADIRAHLRRR